MMADAGGRSEVRPVSQEEDVRMSFHTLAAQTVDDLYRVDGKAELIAGRIVRLITTGRVPNRVAFRIARSLDDHATATGRGEAHTDRRPPKARQCTATAERSCPS
jgi:hypothetical protein